MLTTETRRIQVEERERNRKLVIDILEGEEFPPKETDNDLYHHLIMEDFHTWLEKVKSLINGRLR